MTFACLLGGYQTASADVLYSVTDLGTLGGDSTSVAAINNASQIVGGSFTSSGALHAFLYTNGQMSDIGAQEGYSNLASALNNVGQVVGSAEQAFIYSNGHVTNPGTPSFVYSSGRGINDEGQVAGTAGTLATSAYGFL